MNKYARYAMWLSQLLVVIAADPPYAWSIPINYCPFCGRDLRGED